MNSYYFWNSLFNDFAAKQIQFTLVKDNHRFNFSQSFPNAEKVYPEVNLDSTYTIHNSGHTFWIDSAAIGKDIFFPTNFLKFGALFTVTKDIQIYMNNFKLMNPYLTSNGMPRP